jgi:protein-disulfide isomerase
MYSKRLPLLSKRYNMKDLETAYKLINKNFTILLIVGLAVWGGYNWNKVRSLGTTPIAQAPGSADALGAEAPTAPTGPAGPGTDQLNKTPKVTKEDHIRGNKNAKIVLIEYSDYECPFCAKFHPTMQQVIEEMGDKVAWVYRHYPLPFHPNAQKSAEGSECIAKLSGNDAFWKYSDALADAVNKDGRLSPEAIDAAATTAGVNMTAFKSCLDSDEMATKVKDMSGAGGVAGISGTPGTIVVVDGKAQELIPGALPFSSTNPNDPSVEKILKQYL